MTIVYPLPTYRTEEYETVAVTNSEGRKVKVLALKEGVEEEQPESSISPPPWPLVALGVAFGLGVAVTLLDKFLGPALGWNLEGEWWWERPFKFA